MAIVVDRETRLVVQGLTGSEGRFHGLRNRAYGTNVVAGVTPGKGGQDVEGIPVFDTVAEAVAEPGANTSLIFVPGPLRRRRDLRGRRRRHRARSSASPSTSRRTTCCASTTYIRPRGVTLIGPNCPGVLSPGKANVGIIPAEVFREGAVGLVSRSGTLTYQIGHELAQLGLGNSTIVGIGGDPVVGSSFIDVLERFEADAETEIVVLVGEIGGDEEEKAAALHRASTMSKPVFAYIAGFSAPPGKTMGHAGAIISGSSGTAQAKKEALEAVGIAVGTTPTEVAGSSPSFVRRDSTGRLDWPDGSDLVRARRSRARVPAGRGARRLRARGARARRRRRSSRTARRRLPAAARAGSPSGTVSSRTGSCSRTASLQGFVLLAQHSRAAAERVLVEAPTYDRPLKILREARRRDRAGAAGRRGARPRGARAASSRRAGARVPLHDPDLPEPERPHALDSSAAAGSPSSPPSTSCSCSRTTRTASSASRASRRRALFELDARARRLHLVLLEDDRARACASATSSCPTRSRAALEAAASVDLHHAGAARPGDRVRVHLAAAASSRTSSASAGCCAARRDAMLAALDKHVPGGARWSGPRAATSSGSSCPRAPSATRCSRRAEREGVTFVTGTDFGGARRTPPARLQLRLAGRDRDRHRAAGVAAARVAARLAARQRRGGLRRTPAAARAAAVAAAERPARRSAERRAGRSVEARRGRRGGNSSRCRCVRSFAHCLVRRWVGGRRASSTGDIRRTSAADARACPTRKTRNFRGILNACGCSVLAAERQRCQRAQRLSKTLHRDDPQPMRIAPRLARVIPSRDEENVDTRLAARRSSSA